MHGSCVATIHDGHAKMVLEEAATVRKLELKSTIEYQKQEAQEHDDTNLEAKKMKFRDGMEKRSERISQTSGNAKARD